MKKRIVGLHLSTRRGVIEFEEYIHARVKEVRCH